MLKKIKKLIKSILRGLDYKLIKLNTRKNKVHPYSKPTLKSLKCILNSSGVLHIGAHRGTEAAVYDWLHKKVLWIEANPKIIEELDENISRHFDQRYICALVGNENKKNIDFFISNNDAACSSVYDFSKNVKGKILWKERNFFMSEKIKLDMMTLDNIFSSNNINPQNYSHWVMDIQGAELLALEGAKSSIKFCHSLEIEVSKEDYHDGGAKWMDIKNLLIKENFSLVKEPETSHTEVLFIRNDHYNDILKNTI